MFISVEGSFKRKFKNSGALFKWPKGLEGNPQSYAPLFPQNRLIKSLRFWKFWDFENFAQQSWKVKNYIFGDNLTTQ